MPGIISGKCPEDHPCTAAKACPAGAMSQKGFEAPAIDTGKCTECNRCVEICPRGAIVK